MSEKEHLRHVLLFLFHYLPGETYGEHAPTIRTCTIWLRQFKSGDLNVRDRGRSSGPQKCKDEDLQELLENDPTPTQRQLAEALHVSPETINKISKIVNGPHTS